MSRFEQSLEELTITQESLHRMGRLHRLRYERQVLAQAGFDCRTLRPAARKRALAEAEEILSARWLADRAAQRAGRKALCKRLHSRRLREAMPAWADRDAMAAIYAEAAQATERTGEPHEVDHIVPLLGENVSGLHVEYNLRVIHRTANRRKGNRVA